MKTGVCKANTSLKILTNIYNGITNVENDVWKQVDNIKGDFDPPPPDSKAADILLEIAQQAFSMEVGPRLKGAALPPQGFIQSPGKNYGKYRNATFDFLASHAFSKVKELANKTTYVDPTKKLEQNLIELAAVWKISLENIADATFNGSDIAMENLWDAINDGGFMTIEEPGASELDQSLGKAVYARLIPAAWGGAYPGGDYHDQSASWGVVIFTVSEKCNADTKCPTKLPKGLGLIDEDDISKICHCVHGTMYYLVQMVGSGTVCKSVGNGGGGTTIQCEPSRFTAPKGLDKLDGKAYDNLTLADMITGSVALFFLPGPLLHPLQIILFACD